MHNHSVHWHDGLYLLPQHFQAAEKVILTEDEALNVAANQIGRMPQ